MCLNAVYTYNDDATYFDELLLCFLVIVVINVFAVK